MATGSIILTPEAATIPDGTANNAAPGIVRIKGTGGPPPTYLTVARFDASTKEQLYWKIQMPANFASFPSGAATVPYIMATATTGGVAWELRLAAVTDGDAVTLAAKTFAAANVATPTVPATPGHLDVAAITITNTDSVAAGDLVNVYLARDFAHASDTATGYAYLELLTLTYTTT